jgi:hypothetical protein
MKYQIQAGFSELVLRRTIQHAYPTNLKVSPLAVIPQVGRRGRLLLDLSFPSQVARPASKRGRRNWIVPPPLAPSVDSTTIQQSPDYPVKELGRVLPRLLAFMYCVPCEEVIMFTKINLSDGFWRMLVRESDKWNFAYVIPGAADEPVRLIIPHALQMGWTESPGYSAPPPKPAVTLCWHSLTGAHGYPTCFRLVHDPRRTCPPPEFSRGGQTMANVGRLCRR